MNRKSLLILSLPLVAVVVLVSAYSNSESKYKYSKSDADSTVLRKIYSSALDEGKAYENLRYLCKNVPPRLSGSAGAQKAVEYTFNLMKGMGLDSVWLQECMVPHWERGAAEEAEMIGADGSKKRMNICALGGSVATPKDGLTAEVIEVKDFDDLNRKGKKEIEGKIVFFNHPFDNTFISCFHAYGEAVKYRWAGPHAAEVLGAKGVLVRSMTHSIDTFPHTGVMRMDSLKATIPSAAISTADAEFLSRELQSKKKVNFRMKMNCQWFPDEKSYNVIGEIKGSENPGEVIVFGGHLDAWDTGEGAHDDGAGIMQGIEILRLFKDLGIKPKHTIRCVLWMNEENGGRGGDAYFQYVKKKNEKHLAAIESDAGGFSPRGFGMDMRPEQKARIQSWQPLFFRYGVYDFTQEGGGADIGPLKELGVPQIGLMPDSQRYFDYHHTEIDVFENVNRRELHLGAASMASLVYLLDKYGL